MSEAPNPGEKRDWFDDRANINRLYGALWAVCIVLVLAGFVFVDPEEAHYSWERWSGVALFGFLAYVFIVYAGKFWRLIVKRDEDYYDR